MALVAKLEGIQGPGGFIPTQTLIHFATNVPAVRNEVIAALEKSGHLQRVGLERPGFWRRLALRFRRAPALGT